MGPRYWCRSPCHVGRCDREYQQYCAGTGEASRTAHHSLLGIRFLCQRGEFAGCTMCGVEWRLCTLYGVHSVIFEWDGCDPRFPVETPRFAWVALGFGMVRVEWGRRFGECSECPGLPGGRVRRGFSAVRFWAALGRACVPYWTGPDRLANRITLGCIRVVANCIENTSGLTTGPIEFTLQFTDDGHIRSLTRTDGPTDRPRCGPTSNPDDQW